MRVSFVFRGKSDFNRELPHGLARRQDAAFPEDLPGFVPEEPLGSFDGQNR